MPIICIKKYIIFIRKPILSGDSLLAYITKDLSYIALSNLF